MICLKLDVKTIINIHSLLSICGNSGIVYVWFLMLFRWVHHLLMRSFLPYAPKGSMPVVWGHELIMIKSKRGAWLKCFFNTLILFEASSSFKGKKRFEDKPKLWFCLEVMWDKRIGSIICLVFGPSRINKNFCLQSWFRLGALTG